MSRKFLDQCLRSVDKIFMKPNHFSHKSRYDYLLGTKRIVRELHKGGFQLSKIQHIKPKHVNYLVKEWHAKNLSNATLKNRMSFIRFIFNEVNKGHLLSKHNRDHNVGSRTYISKVNKAITDIDISKFNDRLVRYSVQLQQHFGLRREEAIKFIPSYADQGDHIVLKPSWTKGGLGRSIPVRTPEQRQLLDELQSKIRRDCSLIPQDKDYAYQKRMYDKEVKNAGCRCLHGLRHAYAQKRYFEITNELTQGNGWHAPFNGGKHIRELSKAEHEVDLIARLKVSRELGHARRQIANLYCGV